MVASRGVHVEKALLYGSVAVGRQTTDSDLDIAVVSSDFGHDRFNEGKMLMQIAWRIDPRFTPGTRVNRLLYSRYLDSADP